jgi:hypothetical protein
LSRFELEEFMQRARGLARRSALDSATVEIIDAFEAADVDSVVLKGPALARMLYRPPETRSYYDVDLLVPPAHLAQAREALTRLGYGGGPELLAIDDVADVQNAETWWRPGPADEGGAIYIDLHWRLAGADAPAEAAWAVLAAGRTSIDLDGRRVLVLDRPGLALHLAIHAAQHGPDAAKPIGDLARGLERWPIAVWRSAAALAGEVCAVPAFAAGLRLIPAGADLARALELPATEELTWAILNRESRPRGTFHLQALANSRGGRQRLNVLRRSLFPARRWILEEYRWARGGKLRLAAAYAAHLLRAPLWAARSWRYGRRERAAGR